MGQSAVERGIYGPRGVSTGKRSLESVDTDGDPRTRPKDIFFQLCSFRGCGCLENCWKMFVLLQAESSY